MNIIDFNNGRIDITTPFKLTVDKSLNRGHFVNSLAHGDYENFLINPPYYTYKINAKIILKKWILNFTLCFMSEKLDSINLWITDDKTKKKSWKNWSLDNEMEIKQIHDSILDQEIKSKNLIEQWGTIESFYDPRSGGAEIVMHYK